MLATLAALSVIYVCSKDPRPYYPRDNTLWSFMGHRDSHAKVIETWHSEQDCLNAEFAYNHIDKPCTQQDPIQWVDNAAGVIAHYTYTTPDDRNTAPQLHLSQKPHTFTYSAHRSIP